MDNQNLNNQVPVNNEPAKPNKVTTVLFGLWVVAAFLLLQVAGTIIVSAVAGVKAALAAGGDIAKIQQSAQDIATNPDVLMYAQFVGGLLTVLVFTIWYYNGYVKKDKLAGIYKPVWPKLKNVNSILFIVFASLGGWALASVLSVAACALFPKTAEFMTQALDLALGGGNSVIGLISGVILAPVSEELAMRGIIVQRSKKAFTIVGVAVISAILFGVFHMNLIQGIYVLPLGLLYGYIAYKFNSVVPTMICHFINNLFALTLGQVINPDANVLISTAMFVVCGAVAAFFWTKSGLRDKE